MKIIRTLAGDLPAEQFGIIDYHEHVIARPPVEKPNDIDLSLSDVDTMAKELENFARAGGSLLVDASTADFGDNAHLRLEISQKAGVPVVGTVGFGQKEHHTEAVKNSSVEELYARVTKAVREGYGSQNLRPGQLKFGTSYQFISPSEEKCARAVARAQRDTGLPLFTHTGVGTMALEQLDLLREEGADLGRVCIGHMDRNPDLWLYKEILSYGVFLGLDQVSKVKYCTEQVRISLIMELVRAGYGKRILIGGDPSSAQLSYRFWRWSGLCLHSLQIHSSPQAADAGGWLYPQRGGKCGPGSSGEQPSKLSGFGTKLRRYGP